MKKFYDYLNLKAMALVILTCLFAFKANAQTFPTNTPPAGPYYMGESAQYVFQASGFDAGTQFILWYDLDGDFTLDENEVLGSSSTQDSDVTLTYDWPIVPGGTITELFRLGAYDGNIYEDNALQLDETDFDVTVVGTNNTGFAYQFSRAGVRYYQTEALDLSTTEAKTITLRLDDNGLDVTNPINVQFSTDGGTTFTDIVVASASTDASLVGDTDIFGLTAFNQTFTFDIPVDNASTIIRVRQKDANALAAGSKTWDLNDFYISIGDVYNVISFANDSPETLNEISVNVTEIRDASDNPITLSYPGNSIKIIASIDDIDLANYEFAGYIQDQNTGDVYLLENQSSNEDGTLDEITITGDIPAGVVYDEVWDAFVVAYNGTSPAFGLVFTASGCCLDSDSDVMSFTGYNTSSNEFDGDADRSFTTIPFSVQSVANGSASLTLTKTSNGLAASGTEIVLEYSTDGTTFTQIGSAVSLNSDLSAAIEFDLSAITALISSSTQFRVRQLANSGQDLDTWQADLSVNLGGNVLVDVSEDGYFNYSPASLDINAPTIVLDPVDVPDNLIYPGDQISLTYNITNGEFPTGTEVSAYLDYGQTFMLGTSTEILPGAGQDNSITITVPPIPGGDYNVRLETMGGSISNSVSLPIYETTISITSVDSDNGVFDGTTDVIYPGDNITVNYDINGTIGAGAELFLEYYDYDENDYVVITSSQTINGSITGQLPADANLDNDAASNPLIRLRIGNGLLASNSLVNVENEEGFTMNASFSSNIFDYFQESQTVGNNPQDVNHFIGSTERSTVTIPTALPFGGIISIYFSAISFDSEVGPQNVVLSGSKDGTTFEDLEDIEYNGSGFDFSNVEIPSSLWGESVVFKISYNTDGAAGEFENEISLDGITLFAYDVTQANSDVFNLAGQFRRARITLETNIQTSFIEGETFDVEYTTEGTFPANTGFALVFTGTRPSDGSPTLAVLATSTDMGSGVFNASVPDMAFEGDGTDLLADLYDELEVIAYDASSGDFTPNETITISEDEQFLVLKGTSDSNGNYNFDLDGDRVALTEAFDLSGAIEANVNFNFNSSFTEDDNILVVPQLQYSIDGGATFVNIDVEDSDLTGGYLTGSMAYSVPVPGTALTSATHFRWVQELNLGAGSDSWNINGINIEIINGNEITTLYNAENDEFAISVNHPSLADYTFSQVDKNDAIFNGESTDMNFSKIFETTDNFPTGTTFEFLLEDITDPETNAPLRIATATATGVVTIDIPIYVEEGNYDVSVIAAKSGSEGTYYYAGAEDDGVTISDIDVFLRVIRTILDYPENEPLYAGSTVTFNIDVENDATNSSATSGLFVTLVAESFDDGDLVLATQTGLDPITVDLPPYLRGSYNFTAFLSEGAALGEVGTEINTASDELTNLEDDFENFPSLEYGITTLAFDEYINSNDNYRVEWDWTGDGFVTFEVQRSIDFGEWQTINTYSGTGGTNYQSSSTFLTTGQYVKYRWVLIDGDGLEVSDVRIEDTGNNQENYFGTNLLPTNEVFLKLMFENDLGRGKITSRSFAPEELSNKTLISFDLTFGELAKDITSDQFLVFEYSTDGGATFTEIATFPDTDETEMTLNEENFLFDLTTDMQSNNTIFRFTQEERNGITVEIDHFSFISGEELPFEYESTTRTIANQVVLINDVVPSAICLKDEITISYEIRGRMGADNVVTVSYQEVGGNSGSIDGLEFNVSEGSGDLNVSLPAEIFDAYDNNKWFRFRLNYEDNTSENLFGGNFTYSSSAEPYGEDLVEVIAPAYRDAEISLVSGDLACDPENLIVDLDDPQDYFMYEVFDKSNGSVLGMLTYDPELGETEIDLGSITTNVDLGLRIIPSNSDGTVTCTTITSTHVEEVEILQNYELYLYNDNLGDYEIVTTGQSLTICENAFVELSARRLFESGSTSSASNSQIEWFRDDFDSPLSDVQFLDDSDIIQSGSYFARITDGSCTYITESITITVEPQPDKPVITDDAGNSLSGTVNVGCEGDDPITLAAPTGFAFYEWSTPTGTKTSRVISAEDLGSYRVRVSNRPFASDGNCGSDYSNAVVINRYNLPEFGISTSTNITNGDRIAEGQEIEDCENFTVYFFNDASWTAYGGTIEIIKDGVSEGFTTSSNYTLDESGVYSFNWINDDVPVDGSISCTVSSVSFNLTIYETPDPVEISASGATDLCEGETVTLTAPAGFAQYRWRQNGGIISSNSDGFGNTNNTITVSDDGTYTVEVSNEAEGTGCFSSQSNEIDVNVRQIASDNISFNQIGISCGGGDITFEVFSTDPQWSYQIYDEITDSPIGAPFTGASGNSVFVTIPGVTEQTDYYVIISYADGVGCPQPEPSEFFTASIYNVELVLEGNTITAETIGGFGYSDIEWYRNDIRLVNRSGDNSITVTDNATYHAVVTFNDGDCEISTNAVTIEGARIQTFFGEMEATTYPNPSSDFVTVDMKGGDLGQYNVSIANLSGQVILSESFNKTTEEDSMQVDVRAIEKGVYTLIISKGNTVRSFRIIKQ